MIIVSSSKILYHNCFSAPRGINEYLQGLVLCMKKAFGALQLPVVYSSGSSERLKECFWPNDKGITVKRIETVIVKCTEELVIIRTFFCKNQC